MIINYNDDEEASSPACAASGRYTGFANTRSVVHPALPSAAGADSPSAFSRIATDTPLSRDVSSPPSSSLADDDASSATLFASSSSFLVVALQAVPPVHAEVVQATVRAAN